MSTAQDIGDKPLTQGRKMEREDKMDGGSELNFIFSSREVCGPDILPVDRLPRGRWCPCSAPMKIIVKLFDADGFKLATKIPALA